MKLSGYLVVKKPNKSWGNPIARFVKKAPALDPKEISIKVECNIPDELFTRPQLKFKIDIPKESIPQKEITADVIGNIQELIQSNLGIGIKLIAELPKQEEQ